MSEPERSAAPAEGEIDLDASGGRARRARDQATQRVEELRRRSILVDAALEAGDLDRRRAGSLLAGGIAFRIFLWLLPAALFVAALAGLVRPTGEASPAQVAQSLGLAASVASTVEQATRHSNRGAWTLLALGTVLMFYTATSLVRAVRIAHVLAWEQPLARGAHLARDSVLFSVAIVAAVTIDTYCTYLRHHHVALSILVVPVAFLSTGAVWLGLSLLLPHAGASWRALIPGAALFACAHALLQVATVFYFAPKLTRAPTLYGSLGTAATLLLWLFLLARTTVASAFLNAALWRRHANAAAQALR